MSWHYQVSLAHVGQIEYGWYKEKIDLDEHLKKQREILVVFKN